MSLSSPGANKPRATGILAWGDLPWGSHLCHFYDGKQDLLRTLTRYFKCGLDHGEFCTWVVSPPLTLEESRRALRRAVPAFDDHLAARRIEIVSHREWYLETGRFDLHRVIRQWGEKYERALAEGHAGMRASGNTAWIHGEDWRDFREYEKELDVLLGGKRMFMLCTYPLAGSPAGQILDVARTHRAAVARRKGRWKTVEAPELKRAKEQTRRLGEKLKQCLAERGRELQAANQRMHIFSQLLFQVQEKDRRRLAHEFHDEIGQALTAAKLNLLAVTRTADAVVAARIQETVQILDQLLRDVRQISLDLRPSLLDDLGLIPALRSLLDQQARRAGLEERFSADNLPVNLASETQTTCFRIAQEATTNILRHAHAHSMALELRVLRGQLRLKISDDGVGLDLKKMERRRPESFGLLGIKERAVLAGGYAQIISAPGKGTTIDVHLPLRQ